MKLSVKIIYDLTNLNINQKVDSKHNIMISKKIFISKGVFSSDDNVLIIWAIVIESINLKIITKYLINYTKPNDVKI